MAADHLSLFCPGKPIPQGSKNQGRQGQIYEQNAKKLKVWRDAVRITGLTAARQLGQGPFEGPVELYLDFRFTRPASHLTKNGHLRKGVPAFHTFKPDLDKLTRAALDALSGVFYDDDRQVVSIKAEKMWVQDPEPEGLQVLCIPLRGEYGELVGEGTLGL